jgi:pyrophosphatase PpaX
MATWLEVRNTVKDYDAYLFDWDGTIVRTIEAWIEVVRQAFADYDITDVSDDKIVESLGKLKPVATELGLSGERLNDFMGHTEKLSHQAIPNADLYEGALTTLEHLKNSHKKLGLITSSWQTTLTLLLEKHDLAGLFDVVISGDDVERTKPDPEGINKALATLGVEKDDAVMIGDTEHDMHAAKNAGIDAILFYPPSHQLFYDLTVLTGHNPAKVIAGWEELA